jgi:hypothetical protein
MHVVAAEDIVADMATELDLNSIEANQFLEELLREYDLYSDDHELDLSESP